MAETDSLVDKTRRASVTDKGLTVIVFDMLQFPEEGAVPIHGPAESACGEGECLTSECSVLCVWSARGRDVRSIRAQDVLAGGGAARRRGEARPGGLARPCIYINDVWGAAGARAASARSARCHGAGTAAALTEGFADLAIPPPGSVSVREPSTPSSAVHSSRAITSNFCSRRSLRVLRLVPVLSSSRLCPRSSHRRPGCDIVLSQQY